MMCNGCSIILYNIHINNLLLCSGVFIRSTSEYRDITDTRIDTKIFVPFVFLVFLHVYVANLSIQEHVVIIYILL